jgi:hypothetical protein
MSSPTLEFVRGEPTPEEVAAITAIVVAAAAAPVADAREHRDAGRWNDPALGLRRWDSARRGWQQANR